MKKIAASMVLASLLALGACTTSPAVKPAPQLDMTSFQAVNIDSVSIAAGAHKDLDEPKRLALEAELKAALTESIPESLRAANPGAGVLRIEVLVTEINEVSPGVNALTTALLFVPMDSGGISFEARFHDSTGLIGTNTVSYASKPYKLKGSFDRYGHAIGALRRWGAELGKEMTGG